MSFSQRIKLSAGYGSNLAALAAKGDEEALKELPELLRQRATDSVNQLSAAAKAIEDATKKKLTKIAQAKAKEIQPLLKAIEG